MKPRMIFTISAGLSLATSMLSATTGKPATYTASHRQDVSTSVTPQSLSTLMARGEPEPGDKRGKKDDGKGHKFAELMARGEPEPGDKRGKKDDGKGHKFAESLQA